MDRNDKYPNAFLTKVLARALTKEQMEELLEEYNSAKIAPGAGKKATPAIYFTWLARLEAGEDVKTLAAEYKKAAWLIKSGAGRAMLEQKLGVM